MIGAAEGTVPDTPTVLATGFNSPEGPAFDRHGNLWFVNWLTSSINRLDGCVPGGPVTEVLNTGGIPAGLAFHPDGTLYIADEGDQWHGVLRVAPPYNTISPWQIAYAGKALNGANDLVFANDGTLYFSDPWRSSLENPIGGFYRAFPDGRLEQIDTGETRGDRMACEPHRQRDAHPVDADDIGTGDVAREIAVLATADTALAAIVALINDKFGEGE